MALRRAFLSFTLPALAAGIVATWSGRSLAEPPDSRFGLIPVVGVGMAGLTAAAPLPGFIGYSTLGGELFGQLRTWGLFLRFDFLSSGPLGLTQPGLAQLNRESGLNAYGGTVGASYRLFGDSNSISLFARAGVMYEHWVAEVDTPCAVPFFVPNSCVTEGTATLGYQGDAFGVTAGARLEFPIQKFYVAIGASFDPLVTFNTSQESGSSTVTSLQPGDIFQLRFDLSLGLRDTRQQHAAVHDYNERYNRGY